MPYFVLLSGFVLSVAAGVVFVGLVRRLALRFGWMDAPDGARKVHARAVPNLGGVGILAALIVGMLGMTLARDLLPAAWTVALTPPSALVVLGALVIALVGLADDFLDLRFQTKFVAQVAVTLMAFEGGVRIYVLDGLIGGGMIALGVSLVLTIIWMVGMMNAVNLIDGMDGLAAGVVAIAFLGLAGAHAIGGDFGSMMLVAAIVGALVGFLRHNRHPATIFMGDSGSLLLGYLLATYALRGTAHPNPLLALVIPTVIMGIPVLDTAVSILRRKLSGRPLFSADKDHIHHRLALRTDHPGAVRTLYWFGLFLAVGGLLMAAVPPAWTVLVFALGAAIVYDFLRRIEYLPSPIRTARTIRARRRAAHSETARHAERRARGPLPDDRHAAKAAPER